MKNNYTILYWNGVNWIDVDNIKYSKIYHYIPYFKEVENGDTIAVIFRLKTASSLF